MTTGRARRWLLTVALVLTLAGGTTLALGLARQDPAPPQPARASASASADDRRQIHEGHGNDQANGSSTRAPEPALPASRPVRVRIPSLGVSSSLERLGLDGKRVMETPQDPAKAGWYAPGTTPGARGPAVIAGHVTWDGNPSVFFRLGKLSRGDRIEVTRADGRTAVFTVDRTERHAKKRFPTVDVYRNVDHAGLRLITCGGTYDRENRHYADNVIVFATLTDSRGKAS